MAREHLGLLDGVDAEIRFEVERRIEHVGGVARLLGHQGEHPLQHRIRSAAGAAAAQPRRGADSVPAPQRGGVGAADGAARSGRRSYTNCTTWASVGKSRSLSLSSRGMP